MEQKCNEVEAFISKFDTATKYEVVDQFENNRKAYYNSMADHDTLKRLVDDVPRFPSTGLLQDKQRQVKELEKELNEKKSQILLAKDKLKKEITDVVEIVNNIKIMLKRIQQKRARLVEIDAELKDKVNENQLTFDRRMQDQEKYQDSIFKRQEALETMKLKEIELEAIANKLTEDLDVKSKEYADLESKKNDLDHKIQEKENLLLKQDSKINQEYQDQFAKTNFLKETFSTTDLKGYVYERREKVLQSIKNSGY